MNFNWLRVKAQLEEGSSCTSESQLCPYITCEKGHNEKKEIKRKRIDPFDFKQTFEDIILRTNRTLKGLRNGFLKAL